MDLLDCIVNRKSCRSFSCDEVPNDVLESIISLSSEAPSAHNKQPWSVVVVKDLLLKRKISNMLYDKAVSVGKEKSFFAYNSVSIKEAPVLVLVFNKYEDYKETHELSNASFITHMLLIATNYGLGSLWLKNISLIENEVKKMFDRENMSLTSAVLLGYSNDDNKKIFREKYEFIEWK